MRSITQEDIDGVVEIMNQAIEEQRNAFLQPFDETTKVPWFNTMKEGSIESVIDDLEGEVRGWGSLSSYRSGRGALANVLEITFYVHRDHRGCGVGSKIIEELEEKARQLKGEYLIAILLDDNDPSKGLLTKLNYTQWALFPDLANFGHKRVGHLYMGKKLKT